MTANPWDTPIQIGPVFELESCVNQLRAALHEPLPFVQTQDHNAKILTAALEAQAGVVTDETREQIAKALLIMGGQLAAVVLLSGESVSAEAVCNILGLVGVHVLDGDIR